MPAHPLVRALYEHPFASLAWRRAAQAIVVSREPELELWRRVLVEMLSGNGFQK